MVQSRGLTRRIRVKPLVVGIVFMCMGSKLVFETVSEVRAWHQLARERDTQTTGTITNALAELNGSSGKVLGYEVSYEFTAPADSDSTGGSSVSAAELQERLQEQFWQGQRLTAESTPTDISALEGEAELPEGELFFRGTQWVKPEIYTTQIGDRPTVSVIYDADEPSNSVLAAANTPPSAIPNPPTILFVLGGSWLT